MLKKDRWRIVDELAKSALELPTEQRESYLSRLDLGPSLTEEVRTMLKCACAAGSFLEAPYCEVMGKTRIVRLLAEELPDLGDHFRVIEKIGEGGMGIVYLVEQFKPLQRMLALKVIRTPEASPEIQARFSAEHQAMAWMNHPNIAQIYTTGTTASGRPYFTMEYLPGMQIVTYCRIRKLGLTERLQLFLRVCDGVQHAHLRGVIHRDLKPSNIIIIEQNHEPIPKIIDFGIAKTVRGVSTGSPHLQLDAHVVVGTPPYMSPEQTKNHGKVDTRTDVYALGAILYELVCGRPPLQLETAPISLRTLFKKIQDFEVTPPSEVWVSDPAEAQEATGLNPLRTHLCRTELDAIVQRALAKNPTQRYDSVQDLALQVKALLLKSRFIPTELFRKFLAWLTPRENRQLPLSDHLHIGRRDQATRWHFRRQGRL